MDRFIRTNCRRDWQDVLIHQMCTVRYNLFVAKQHLAKISSQRIYVLDNDYYYCDSENNISPSGVQKLRADILEVKQNFAGVQGEAEKDLNVLLTSVDLLEHAMSVACNKN